MLNNKKGLLVHALTAMVVRLYLHHRNYGMGVNCHSCNAIMRLRKWLWNHLYWKSPFCNQWLSIHWSVVYFMNNNGSRNMTIPSHLSSTNYQNGLTVLVERKCLLVRVISGLSPQCTHNLVAYELCLQRGLTMWWQQNSRAPIQYKDVVLPV